MDPFQPNKKSYSCFLVLAFLTALVIFQPFLDFQSRFAQGDHGHNLYSYYLTFRGEVPYRDYYYAYGPVMPYVYSFFYFLGGVSAKSVILGDILFGVLSGLCFFACVSLVASPLLAYVATVWFWIFNHGFFYTYNHTGGMALLLAGVYYVIHFIKTGNKKSVLAAQFLFSLLCLIKLNTGIVNLVALNSFLLIYDRLYPRQIDKVKSIIMPLVAGLLSVGTTYYFLLRGLPSYVVNQCLPYFSSTYQQWREFNTVSYFFKTVISLGFSSWQNALFSIFVLICAGYFVRKILSKNAFSSKEFMVVVVITIFLIVNSHEFLGGEVIDGFRWISPFLILMAFVLIGLANLPLPAAGTLLIYGLILSHSFYSLDQEHKTVRGFKVPAQFMQDPRLKIYVRNSPECIVTFEKTADFLRKHLRKDETFLALPYEGLYYFLADKKSPVWEIAITEEAGITPQEEEEMIRRLEKKDVRFVVMSNRAVFGDRYIGIFGKTYLLRLSQYIDENFNEVTRFGDWTKEPTWLENHAVKILERKMDKDKFGANKDLPSNI